jgi:hypothetical protein
LLFSIDKYVEKCYCREVPELIFAHLGAEGFPMTIVLLVLEGVICAGVMQSHRYMRLSCIGLTFYTVRYLGAWALVLVIAVPFFLTRGTIEALQERFPKK